MKYLIKIVFTVLMLSTFFAFTQPSSADGTQESIVYKTASSENHQTLLAVMKATDLEELLDETGPFTIFAPTDSAFENLSGKSVQDLLNPENKQELKDLLTYHIVAGNLSASKILKAMCRGEGKATFTTVHGDEITATMKGIDIILTDSFGNSATIIVADSNQRNGVIHEIDSVILPSRNQS